MKKTRRQSTTSTIGVMLICGNSSEWRRSESISDSSVGFSRRAGLALPRSPGRQDEPSPTGSMRPRLAPDVVDPPVGRPGGFGGDLVDDPACEVVEIADEDVDAVEEVIVRGHGDHRDG